MKLSFAIPKSCVFSMPGGSGSSGTQAVREIVDRLFAQGLFSGESVSKERALEELALRERNHGVTMGDGFAFPHARIDDLKNFYGAFAVFKGGLEERGMDGRAVHFMLLTLCPSSKINMLLQTRAAFLRCMRHESFQRRILENSAGEAIWTELDNSGVRIDGDILASDLMAPPVANASPDMTLSEAALLLNKCKAESLPVVDKDGKFQGDITCAKLFAFGMPVVFSSFQTISFIKHFNPVEKYFQSDSKVRLHETAILKDAPIAKPDATLVELLFEFGIKKRTALYIVDGGRLLGVIDSHSVIDKILTAN